MGAWRRCWDQHGAGIWQQDCSVWASRRWALPSTGGDRIGSIATNWYESMNSASEHSTKDSAKTSKKPPEKLPESDFLSRERGTTRRAIRTSTKRLRRLGGEMKVAAGRHPFLLAGLGAVAGAGVTAILVWRLRVRQSRKTTHPTEESKARAPSNHLWLRLLSIPLKAVASSWMQRLAVPATGSDGNNGTDTAPQNASVGN